MSGSEPTDDPERVLIEVPSPFALEPGTLRMFEPAIDVDKARGDSPPDGDNTRPFIIDYGKTRSLFFTTASVQSSMRLDDPLALIAPYTRKMMAFLLFLPAPRHVLMIGLGGGSLAKFCHRHLPCSRISVVEINAEVIALRDQFMVPPDDERFEVIHEDGAHFLARADMRPDVILVDAFDESGVSPSLAASDFYHQASRCMMPNGVLVMNLSGLKSRYTAHIERIRTSFHGAIRLVPVGGDDNLLLFAFKGPHTAELPEFLQHRARYLEQGLGLEFSRYLERLRAGEVLTRTVERIATARPK